MRLYRSRLQPACLWLAAGALLAGCAGTGSLFVPVVYPPDATAVSPLATPAGHSPLATPVVPPAAHQIPEPAGSPEAAQGEGAFPNLTSGGRSPLATPGAVPAPETPKPVGSPEAAQGEGALPTPTPGDSLPPATPTPAGQPVEIPESFEPLVAAYDLGEFSIAQPGNPAGDMPARLRGLIGVPDTAGAHPVVVILHGAGFGCPPKDDVETAWPCGDAEQPNWTGFSYLASALAARGYIALVPDANAQYEAAYGEARGFDRLTALTRAHLERLAAAGEGWGADFGSDLTDRVDLRHVLIAGHGRGADGALAMALPQTDGLDPYKIPPGRVPVSGLLLIAPEGQPQRALGESEGVSVSSVVSVTTSLPDVPTTVILPECDGNVPELDGARYYDAARLAEGRKSLAAEVFLPAANHNAFNSFFQADDGEVVAEDRPGCEPESRLGAPAQRKFLAQYAADFFDAILGGPGADAAAATAGLDPALPEPDFLYWQAALTSLAAPADKRLRLVSPGSAVEVNSAVLNGQAQAVPPAEMTFCPGDPVEKSPCAAGFHPPGGAPFPGTLRIAWDGAGGLYQIEVPAVSADLTRYVALSLRAAVDPADPRSQPIFAGPEAATPAPIPEGQARAAPTETPPSGPNAEPAPGPEGDAAGAGARWSAPYFSVVLRDAAGGAAAVDVPAEIPALAYPAGGLGTGENPLWTAFTPLSSIRIPLAAFAGVDLSQVAGVAFSFGGLERGAIRIADVEFVAR
jgi:hypothetical protein